MSASTVEWFLSQSPEHTPISAYKAMHISSKSSNILLKMAGPSLMTDPNLGLSETVLRTSKEADYLSNGFDLLKKLKVLQLHTDALYRLEPKVFDAMATGYVEWLKEDFGDSIGTHSPGENILKCVPRNKISDCVDTGYAPTLNWIVNPDNIDAHRNPGIRYFSDEIMQFQGNLVGWFMQRSSHEQSLLNMTWFADVAARDGKTLDHEVVMGVASIGRRPDGVKILKKMIKKGVFEYADPEKTQVKFPVIVRKFLDWQTDRWMRISEKVQYAAQLKPELFIETKVLAAN